jgi:hypothetical protein
MKSWKLGAISLLGAVSFSAASADAATYLVSFDGIVDTGSDTANLFGSGGDLSGKLFHASFSFEFPSSDVTVDERPVPGKGALSRVQATSSDAALRINGQTVAMGSDDVDYVRGLIDGTRLVDVRSDHFIIGRQFSKEFQLSLNISSTDPAFFSSVKPFDPVDFTINDGRGGAGGTGQGSFSITVTTPERISTSASGTFLVRHVRVEELVASVPEPATWAMMIAGFGLVGGGVRSRRSRRAWRAAAEIG